MTRADKTLNDLEQSKRTFGAGDAKILRAVSALSRSRLTEANSLIRLHEALLFLRAYPSSARVLKQVETILKTFGNRVRRLREADADFSAFENPEASGIAGTSVTSNFSYPIVRWLVEKYPR